MELEALAAMLGDRSVPEIVKAMIYSIDLLPPSGASVHKRGGIIGILNCYLEDAYSFKQFSQRDNERYNRLLRTLNRAIEELYITI